MRVTVALALSAALVLVGSPAFPYNCPVVIKQAEDTIKKAEASKVSPETRQLIDEAAAILGKTRTEFMIESARRQAIDVLLDQRLFGLDPRRYDAFMHVLDNPPAPGPKLRSLLRRVPAWEK